MNTPTLEPDRLVKLSKMLAKHLRHKPGALGLTLEPGGWVRVDALLEAFGRKGFVLTRPDLERVVQGNDKQRFAFDATKERIRANQGHSIEVDLALEPQTPPDVLYHGTARQNLESILSSGLQKMRRHHVHLSSEVHTARAVGARYGVPVVLRVDARAMGEAGLVFFCSENGVWLTGEVPARFLEVMG